jgi:aspartate-semialdehyde dehydrogenase
VVAGVNLVAAVRGAALASPHPGAVLLAHLLHPLRRFGLAGASAVVVQPSSFRDKPGLDELFGQARNMVAMRAQDEPAVFGRQLAFNLLPTPVSGPAVAGQVRAALGGGEAAVPLAVRVLQGAVFHGVSAAVHLRLDGEADPAAVREALGEHPFNRLAEDSELLGPIDAAASDEVLIGGVEAVAAAYGGGVWLWGVMDNLTRGGALNAVAILEQVRR